MITQERIEIIGLNKFVNCSVLHIENNMSMHPKAIIVGELIDDLEKDKLYSKIYIQKIIVKCKSSENKSENLFVGYINKIEVIEDGSKHCKVKLELICGSSKLDHKKYYRSYQDVSKTYGEIINQVAIKMKQVNVETNLQNDKPIEMPVIQYEETDWDFIKRMASNCNQAVVVDETREILTIIVGNNNRIIKGNLDSCEYNYGISNRYYETKAFDSGLELIDFEYVKVKSKQIYNICDNVLFKNKKYYIYGKNVSLIDGEIIYTYILGKDTYSYENKYDNKRFAGCTILGTVEKTSNETVQLQLNLRDEEDSTTKYDYNWVPESGNIMYCMPQVGTTVSLYFCNESEKSGIVINCIRTNGGSGDIYSKDEKIFTSEYDKGFKLSNQAMDFVTEKGGEQLAWLSLLDNNGIVAMAQKQISIHAKVAIALLGQVVELDAKEKLIVFQNDNLPSPKCYIYIYNDFQIIGLLVDINLIDIYHYKYINDEPKKKEFEWGKWLTNLAVGLLVAAAVAGALALCLFTAGAGAAIAIGALQGALAAGVFEVACIQVGDLMSGKVTDTKDVIKQVAVESFVGGVTGAIGKGVEGYMKLEKFATKMQKFKKIKLDTIKKLGKIGTEVGNEALSTTIKNIAYGKDFSFEQYLENMFLAGSWKGLSEFHVVQKITKGADKALSNHSNIYNRLNKKIANSSLSKKINGLKADKFVEDLTPKIEDDALDNIKSQRMRNFLKRADKEIAKNAKSTVAKNAENAAINKELRDAYADVLSSRGFGKTEARAKVKKLQSMLDFNNAEIKKYAEKKHKLLISKDLAKIKRQDFMKEIDELKNRADNLDFSKLNLGGKTTALERAGSLCHGISQNKEQAALNMGKKLKEKAEKHAYKESGKKIIHGEN